MRYSVRLVLGTGFSIVIGLFLLTALLTFWTLNQVWKLELRHNFLVSAKLQSAQIRNGIQEVHSYQIQLIFSEKASKARFKIIQQRLTQHLIQLQSQWNDFESSHLLEKINKSCEKMILFFESTYLFTTPDSSFSQEEFLTQLEVLLAQVYAQLFNLNAYLENQTQVVQESHQRLLKYIQLAPLVMLCLAVLFASLVGLAITQFIGNPLQNLHRAFAHLGSGNLETQLQIRGPFELQDLAKRFNQMAKSLIELQQKMIEQERMVVMGEISAGVAHELNNPLAVILGYTKLLKKSNTQQTQALEDIKIIEDEIHRCQQIIDGLLDLARPKILRFEEVDLISFIQEVFTRFEISQKIAPSIHLRFQPPSSPFLVWIDEASFRRVLINLLRNAYEALGSQGEIRIELTGEDSCWILSVCDTGIGILDEFKAQLFKPFKTSKPKGIGLGLAICLSIIKNHHGEIVVESVPNQGTCFRLKVPWKKDFE